MAAPSNPGPSPVVMDLGLRSDPNLHRAYRGPFRVRIEARQRSGWRRRDFWKADREIDIHVGDRNLERKVVEKKPSPYSTSGVPTIGVMPAQNACGSKEVGTPPFPFPPLGESRGGRVPPTPLARCAPAKSAGTHRCRGSPRKRGFKARR